MELCEPYKQSRFFRAILTWVSKVIRNVVGFLYFALWLAQRNLRHSLNQSDAKLTPIETWSHAFSLPALWTASLALLWILIGSWGIFLSSDWLLWQLWFLLYGTQSKTALAFLLSLTATCPLYFSATPATSWLADLVCGAWKLWI